MKANILNLTAFLLFMSVCFSSCNKEDMDSSAYSNPENFKLTKLIIYSGSTNNKPIVEIEYEYDKAGNKVKQSYFNYQPTRTLCMYLEYEYSGNQKVSEKKFTGVPGNLKLEFSTNYFYENNRLVREDSKWEDLDDSYSFSLNYEYDNRGNLVRKYNYSRGIISGEVEYSYDIHNRLILEEGIEDYSIYYHKYIKYTYDDNGRETKMELFNMNWDLLSYVEKVYNGTNKLPEKELGYDENGIQTSKHQHFYDNLGNLTETTLNDKSLFKRKYKGRLLIEEIHQPSFHSEISIYKYEYEKYK